MPGPTPSRQFSFTGRAMSKAPRYLRPYLDCVDGAVLTDRVTQGFHVIATIWQLYRGGEHVGTVEIDMAGLSL